MTSAVRTPLCSHSGLGSFHFARRYFGNRCFFLFLRLLRCFSSPGSLPYVMDWRMDTYSLCTWVSPFRYLRIIAYLQLPEAFRSLSRLSSALSAKASTLRSLLLNHTCKNKSDCIALQSLCCSKELRYISISSCYFFDVSLHLRHFCRPRMSCLIILKVFLLLIFDSI